VLLAATKVKFFCPGAEGGLLLGHLHIIDLQEGEQSTKSTKESNKESESEDENDEGESDENDGGESEEEVRIFGKKRLAGGFKYVLCSPPFGEDSHFDQYVSKGLETTI